MNNCSSQKIKCILEQGRKYREKYGIVGPTGPRGPQGPATIRVGNTVTGEAGTDALVTNTGTLENVVLSFTIPQGVTGPTGPTGSTGPQGETGPRGETGEQGPPGPSSLNVYGSKYDVRGNNIDLVQDVIKTVPLTTVGPTQGITGNMENVLIVPSAGVYKIDYFFQGSSSVDTTITISVLKNGNSINGTSIDREFEIDVDASVGGSVITTLEENDEISLGLESTLAAQLSPAVNVNAYLNIIKLS